MRWEFPITGVRGIAPGPAPAQFASQGKGDSGVVDAAARALDIPAAAFLVETFTHGAAARPGRDSRLPFDEHRIHEIAQPLEGGVPVAGLGPVFLRLDCDDPGRRNAAVVERKQSIAHVGGHGAVGDDVELQVNGCGHLVHVLSACAPGADRGQNDLVHRDGDFVAYLEQVCHVVQTGCTPSGSGGNLPGCDQQLPP